MADKLTDLQSALMEALFGEAAGDFKVAAKMAGYPAKTSLSVILAGGLKEAIIDRAKAELAVGAPKAVFGLLALVDEPTTPGAKIKLSAASQVLDRVNIVKTDFVQLDTKGGLFILPSKDAEDGVSLP